MITKEELKELESFFKGQEYDVEFLVEAFTLDQLTRLDIFLAELLDEIDEEIFGVKNPLMVDELMIDKFMVFINSRAIKQAIAQANNFAVFYFVDLDLYETEFTYGLN